MKYFVPIDFVSPQAADLAGGFHIEKLTIACLQEDYDAFMSSMEAIHAQRGPYWPTPDFTLEENRKDLYWHEKEFDENLSFAYVIRDTHGAYIGCCYIQRPDFPWLTPPEGCDAVINFWLARSAYGAGRYDEFYHTFHHWVRETWPFQHIWCSNLQKPIKHE